MDRNDVCFIRAKQLKGDYVFSGIAKSGYRILMPYKDTNIVFRALRELWMRLGLPIKCIWYNKAVKNIEQRIIIVKDPLISADFVKYLRKYNQNRLIIFDYDNRVGRSINPDNIRNYVNDIWSYDDDDCRLYGLKNKGNAFLDIYRTKTNQEKEFDVLFIGRDKGRLDEIHYIENQMKEQGLKTYFYICADREFLISKKREYKHFLPYEEYLELLKKSRAILNVVPEGQRSVTQREMEAVFDGIKCITTNKGITAFPLYDETRYFILDNNFNQLQKFLDLKFKDVEHNDLEQYTFSASIEKLISDYQ